MTELSTSSNLRLFQVDSPTGPDRTSEAIDEDSSRVSISSPATAPLQEIFCPVFGQILLRPSEIKILDHFVVNRLRDIRQLGLTSYVYPGANHSRFEHAIGTLHVAVVMISYLNRNAVAPDIRPHGEWLPDSPLSPTEVSFIRLAALLHDVGHIAAGHTFEDELGLLHPHDSDVRLELLLDRDEWLGEAQKPLRMLIEEEYGSQARSVGFDNAAEALLAIISKDRRLDVPEADAVGFRVGVCRSIVSDTVCADLLDYLHRDWHHLGKPQYFDTRVLEYMELRTRTDADGVSPEHVVVVNLRDSHDPRHDAVTAILDLLDSRYQLFEIALFHRTKLTAAAMLERAVSELAFAKDRALDDWLAAQLPLLLQSSDVELLDLIRNEAQTAAESRKDREKERLNAAASLVRDIRLRRFHARLYSVSEVTLGNQFCKDIQTLYDSSSGTPDGRRLAAKRRLTAVQLLEDDFGLPAGSIVMYCPPAAMNSKLAKVRTLMNGEVRTLDEHEDRANDKSLTAGMLGAQSVRFQRLWRVQFGIRRDLKRHMEESGVFHLLQRAIEQLVLPIRLDPTDGGASANSEALARQLAAADWQSPLRNQPIELALAVNRRRYVRQYPTEAPALIECIAKEATEEEL